MYVPFVLLTGILYMLLLQVTSQRIFSSSGVHLLLVLLTSVDTGTNHIFARVPGDTSGRGTVALPLEEASTDISCLSCQHFL